MPITSEQINDHLNQFNSSLTEIDLTSNPHSKRLSLATIFYFLVKNSAYESLLIGGHKDELKNACHQMFNQLLEKVLLNKKEEFNFAFRNYQYTRQRQYAKEYIATLLAIQENQALQNIFLNILFCQDTHWAAVANNLDSIRPAASEQTCKKNALFTWIFNHISGYKTQILSLNLPSDHTELVYVVVAFKIYLERIRYQIKTFPMKRDALNLEVLKNTLTKLVNCKPRELDMKIINSDAGENAYQQLDFIFKSKPNILGRDVINYFMEPLQIETLKNGQRSYKDTMTTALLIIEITQSLRKTSQNRATFSERIYIDTVPYASFRPVFIKDLITLLRKQREIDSVFDPCGGWGGTILGATISNVTYIADNDVNPGLKEPKSALVTFLKDNISNPNIEYNLLQENIDTFSEYRLHGRKVALICTSPPFFNFEKYDSYNQDGAQSRTAKSYDQWMNIFVPKYIENSVFHLQEGGFFALQISYLFYLDKFVSRVLKKIIDSHLFDAHFAAIPYSNYGSHANPDKKNIHYFFVFTKKMSIPPSIHCDDLQFINGAKTKLITEDGDGSHQKKKQRQNPIPEPYYCAPTPLKRKLMLFNVHIKEQNQQYIIDDQDSICDTRKQYIV